MRLVTAREILEELYTLSHDGKDPDWQGAIKLGIEALKVVAGIRKGEHMFPPLLLPGETEE